MSRKIKINYKNLNSNLKKITYHFFTDWIIEMLPVELMKFVLNHYKFKTDKFEFEHYLGLICKLIKEEHDIFIELVIMNNETVKINKWDEKSLDLLMKDYYHSDLTFALGNRRARPEMMLVYYYSKGLTKKEEFRKTLEFYIAKTDESIDEIKNSVDLKEYYSELRNSLLQKDLLKFDVMINQDKNNQGIDGEKDYIKVIENKFKCNFINGKFNGLNKELMYYINISLGNFEEAKVVLDITTANLLSTLKLVNNKQKDIDNQVLNKLKKENYELRVTFSNQDINKIEEDYVKIKRENYLLNLEVERLRSRIAILEEEERINETIQEELKIEDIYEIKNEVPKMSSICILGGKWNSLRKGQIEEYFWNYKSDVEFFEAEKILRYQERIKNKDIVIFDTSYNSHSLYYKFKDFIDLKISESNLLKIKNLFEKEIEINEENV